MRLEGHLEATTDRSTPSDRLNLRRAVMHLFICKNTSSCARGTQSSLVPKPPPSFPSLSLFRTASDGKLGGGLGTRLHTKRIMMCVLLPCNGVKDLHFGFQIFTDTEIDQPVKPTKDRERERKGLLQYRRLETAAIYRPAWSKQCWIKKIWSVSGSNDKHLLQPLQPIQL